MKATGGPLEVASNCPTWYSRTELPSQMDEVAPRVDLEQPAQPRDLTFRLSTPTGTRPAAERGRRGVEDRPRVSSTAKNSSPCSGSSGWIPVGDPSFVSWSERPRSMYERPLRRCERQRTVLPSGVAQALN